MFAVYFDPTSSIYVAGGETFIDDIITGAGGVNSFGNISGYPPVSKEAAAQENPDYIIIAATMNSQSPQEVFDSVMNDTLLKNTTAVQHNHVYIVINQAENSFLHEGIREVQATMVLAEIMYPGTFNKTIPHIVSDEYLDYLPLSWNASPTGAHMVMETTTW
jgi:iron complex transport system substrate-binding protein